MKHHTIRNILKTAIKYPNDKSLTIEFWAKNEQNYSDKKRHYHSHLNNLLKELIVVKNQIESWETVLFTMFYHDIIYNSLISDNAEKVQHLQKNE